MTTFFKFSKLGRNHRPMIDAFKISPRMSFSSNKSVGKVCSCTKYEFGLCTKLTSLDLMYLILITFMVASFLLTKSNSTFLEFGAA